jgi:hypothetical protein
LASDRQVGPEWWLASDGRWYPPVGTAIPQVSASRPATELGRRTISRGLSGTLQGFLWVNAALALLIVLFTFAGYAAYSDWQDAATSADRSAALRSMVDADDAIAGSAVLGSLAGLVAFILLIIWANQSHKASQQRWTGNRSWSSGWTVGAWFIPFANLFLPKMVLTETERIGASAAEGGGQVADGWQQRPVSAVGVLWWVLLVLGLFIGQLGTALSGSEDSGNWGTGYLLAAVGYGAAVASGVLGALYVRKVTRYFAI